MTMSEARATLETRASAQTELGDEFLLGLVHLAFAASGQATQHGLQPRARRPHTVLDGLAKFYRHRQNRPCSKEDQLARKKQLISNPGWNFCAMDQDVAKTEPF